MKRKRLAILTYSLASGGAERVVSVLLPELKKWFDVTLVLMNEEIFYEIPEGVRIRYLGHSDPSEPGWKKLLKLPFLARAYRKFCREEGIEISLSFMTRPNYINLLAKKSGSDIRTIISERSMPSKQYGYPGITSYLNRFLIRRLYPLADRIVANSEGNRQDLIEHFDLLSEKITTIYNPFDVEKIREMMENAPPFEKKGFFAFITVGRVDVGKNHRLLVEALATLGKEIPAKLIIVGEGPLDEELRRYVKHLGIEEKILWAGRQSNPFVWMGFADCFVFGSNHEGFPNVLVEALACGLPVISTDCLSGPREILAMETNYNRPTQGYRIVGHGLLIETGNVGAMAAAMKEVYNNILLHGKLVNTAKKRAEDFEKSKIVRHFIDLLEGREFE